MTYWTFILMKSLSPGVLDKSSMTSTLGYIRISLKHIYVHNSVIPPTICSSRFFTVSQIQGWSSCLFVSWHVFLPRLTYNEIEVVHMLCFLTIHTFHRPLLASWLFICGGVHLTLDPVQRITIDVCGKHTLRITIFWQCFTLQFFMSLS